MGMLVLTAVFSLVLVISAMQVQSVRADAGGSGSDNNPCSGNPHDRDSGSSGNPHDNGEAGNPHDSQPEHAHGGGAEDNCPGAQ